MSPDPSTEPLSALDELVAKEAISRCKYRYLRCLDLKLWDEMMTTLAPDATASYSGGGYSFDNPAEIKSFLVENMGSEQILSSHRVSQPEIELLSATEATATWALDDVVIREDFDVMIRGAAFYEDRYRVIDGDWVIAHTGYRRLYEELVPRASIEGMRITASWWRTDGRSELAPQ